MSSRHASLDYLRGLMALAVLVFHFQKMAAGGFWDASTVIGKLGIYAVSIFFVLSGLTLALVYEKFAIGTWAGVFNFFKKRVARIFPLLWLVTVATFCLDRNLGLWDFSDLALNLTGLFGFVSPARDIALGAWSLGNELVFYAIFPVLWLFFNKKWLLAFWAVLVSSVAIASFYAFLLMKKGAGFHEQYAVYVQPAQHFFFFAAGCGIGFFHKKWAKTPALFWKILLTATVAAFVFWPTGPDPSSLLFGKNRLALSAISIVICAAVFGSQARFSGKTHAVLTWLADCSYTIYLLHPLVLRLAKWANDRFFHAPNAVLIVAAFSATMLASHFVFKKYELPAKRWILHF